MGSAHIRYRRRRRRSSHLRRLERALGGEPRAWSVLLGYDPAAPMQSFVRGKVWPSRIWAKLSQHAEGSSGFSLLIKDSEYATLYADLRLRVFQVRPPLRLHMLTYVTALQRTLSYALTAWDAVAVAYLTSDARAIKLTWVL